MMLICDSACRTKRTRKSGLGSMPCQRSSFACTLIEYSCSSNIVVSVVLRTGWIGWAGIGLRRDDRNTRGVFGLRPPERGAQVLALRQEGRDALHYDRRRAGRDALRYARGVAGWFSWADCCYGVAGVVTAGRGVGLAGIGVSVGVAVEV